MIRNTTQKRKTTYLLTAFPEFPIISRVGGASFGDSLFVAELLDVCPESSLGGVVGPGSAMKNYFNFKHNKSVDIFKNKYKNQASKYLMFLTAKNHSSQKLVTCWNKSVREIGKLLSQVNRAITMWLLLI